MHCHELSVVLVICLVTSFTDAFSLKMKPPGASVVKAQGKSMLLTCLLDVDTFTADSNDSRSITEKIRFQWVNEQGKEILETTGRKYVEFVGEGIKLYITTIEMSDAGRYTCKATLKSDTSKTAEKTISLALFEDIRFVNVQESQHPPIHTDALIKCVATGNPKPEISWKYKGDKVNMNGRYSQTEQGLLIRNVSKTDDGNYTCRAEVEDEGRYGVIVIEVAIHIPPKMGTELEDTESVEGRSVSMQCKAEGLPSPSYKFFKDGVEVVSEGSGKARSIVDSVAGKLTLNPLNRSDQGKYECRASNDVGQAISKAALRVLIPAVVNQFNNVTMSEAKKLTLTCVSSGDPLPTVVINRGSRNYSTDDEDDDEGFEITSTRAGEIVLSVERVRVEDAGDYTCIAANKVGQQRATATVTVHYKPRFSKTNDLLVYSWAGAQHNLTCQSFGLPIPSMSWQRNGVKLQPNNTFRMFEWSEGNSTSSSLQVTVEKTDVTWIFGMGYTCEASNTLGVERQEYELKRAMNPDVPRGVKIIERLADAVTIEVEEPLVNGGIPVTGYTVSYSEKPAVGPPGADVAMNTEKQVDGNKDDNSVKRKESNSVELLDDKDDQSGEADTEKQLTKGNVIKFKGNKTRIVNLKPETNYLLKVKARNQVGPGPELEKVVTTDKQSAPGKIVIKSLPNDIDGRRFDLKWEVHNSGGLPIIEYQFNYTKVPRQGGSNAVVPTGGWTIENVEVKSPMEVYTLANLSPQSTYWVKMRARNRLGWSPATEQFQFTTVAAGKAVLADLTQGGVGGMLIGLVFLVLLPVLLIVDIWRYKAGRWSLAGIICCCLRSPRTLKTFDKNDLSKKTIEDKEKPTTKVKHRQSNENNTDDRLPLRTKADAEHGTDLNDVIVLENEAGEPVLV